MLAVTTNAFPNITLELFVLDERSVAHRGVGEKIWPVKISEAFRSRLEAAIGYANLALPAVASFGPVSLFAAKQQLPVNRALKSAP